MTKKKIGFFGGTFDPIHFGHLLLVEELAKKHHLDEVWFCPAYCSVFKTSKPPQASVKHRLAMLELALEGYPAFKICRAEIEKGTVCYTVDTLRLLSHPEIQFYLLLSDESFASLARWKEPEELARLAPPLVGKRTLISSTKIRKRLKKGLTCKDLVPAKVLDYILAHRLYSALPVYENP